MHVPEHGSTGPPGPPLGPGAQGQHEGNRPPPAQPDPGAPQPGHPYHPAPPGYHPGTGYPGSPAPGLHHQRPAKVRQPATVIVARVFTFTFGGIGGFLGLILMIGAIFARSDSTMGADAERVSNEMGIVALVALGLAAVFLVLGGIGGRRSPGVMWAYAGVYSALAVASVVGFALEPRDAAIVGLIPCGALLGLVLAGPARKYYTSGSFPRG